MQECIQFYPCVEFKCIGSPKKTLLCMRSLNTTLHRNSVCKIRALQIFWRSKNPADEANLQTKSPADSNWWNKNRNFVLILRNLWSKNPPVAVFGLQETSPTPRLQCGRKGNWRSCRRLCAQRRVSGPLTSMSAQISRTNLKYGDSVGCRL